MKPSKCSTVIQQFIVKVLKTLSYYRKNRTLFVINNRMIEHAGVIENINDNRVC